jgi:hypothetical protein
MIASIANLIILSTINIITIIYRLLTTRRIQQPINSISFQRILIVTWQIIILLNISSIAHQWLSTMNSIISMNGMKSLRSSKIINNERSFNQLLFVLVIIFSFPFTSSISIHVFVSFSVNLILYACVLSFKYRLTYNEKNSNEFFGDK